MTPVETWFSKRRFGLFLHFGLYSINAWHEQDQMRRRIPRNEYEKLISQFNPTNFDPEKILDFAESVGMEYICLTTKHHDGFCLWNTKQTDFNVMNSPYGEDIVKQLADACHKRDFPLGLYYSVVDWRHPNYPNRGRHHELAEPEKGDKPDWNKYMDYLQAQVKELCTNYGEIRHFFWDMNVPEFHDTSINSMIRSLQPNIVINNRGFDAGDFGTPERDYDSDDTNRLTAFSLPTEACNSVGTQSWGYRRDEDYYSASFLIDSMDSMMSKGAHYLLNVGPDASGEIPDISADILKKIGHWYKRVNEAFNDAVPCSELTTNKHVLLTKRDNNLYVHVKRPVQSDAILLPPITELPLRATLLNNSCKLKCSNEILPMYWETAKPILRIKKIPREYLTSDETLIIKLEFQNLSTDIDSALQKFQG